MINRWRIAALQVTTAAFVMAAAGTASAQTVYMRNAPAGMLPAASSAAFWEQSSMRRIFALETTVCW